VILKAAILQKDSRIVYTGKRHGDCFKIMQDAGVRYKYCVQGFVDGEGNFLDRYEAYQEALRCNQIAEKIDTDETLKLRKHLGILHNLKILISEDLY
jgi:hypothetical protein